MKSIRINFLKTELIFNELWKIKIVFRKMSILLKCD